MPTAISARRRAVFLDRDGTLNVERHFVRDPAEIELLHGVLPAVRTLRDAGLVPVVITNQSGIARGYFDEARLAAIHARLHGMLERVPRAYLHCPHHPDLEGRYGGACRCRKPALGLVEDAADLLQLELRGSYVIGDSARDLLHTRARGLRSILVRSGKPWRAELQKLTDAGAPPEHVADDLATAAQWILRCEGRGAARRDAR